MAGRVGEKTKRKKNLGREVWPIDGIWLVFRVRTDFSFEHKSERICLSC